MLILCPGNRGFHNITCNDICKSNQNNNRKKCGCKGIFKPFNPTKKLFHVSRLLSTKCVQLRNFAVTELHTLNHYVLIKPVTA